MIPATAPTMNNNINPDVQAADSSEDIGVFPHQ